jgi:tRNA (Thr-GGU) A37 N-methylase
MNIFVGKETRLNIRVKPDFKKDLEAVADFHGLTVSSYVHSVLVKKMREEKDDQPQIFDRPESKNKDGAPVIDIGTPKNNNKKTG